jgi:glucosamine 6-phosphate synthetase-like amidotransferase/phosphosugar isomerase protein
MCNIIGYVGANDVAHILVDGLERLEHQSYDASGMAVRKDETFTIEKQLGRVKNLSNAISSSINF